MDDGRVGRWAEGSMDGYLDRRYASPHARHILAS